ncbi:HlyD family type I secretion periplasmic adaptor subunit [Pontivivens ytuae]|uniref:Membrane fusion protein (MFP) family protein n=2 Tax=Pontivivens ytuae TaxID=2789856 RepID=A0A7S9QFA1_9RHOB|nr:HlyD family type I secretion periplasmic adaptor subunit [Pontivivens ytuae]
MRERRRGQGIRGSLLLFAILAFLVLAVFWASVTEIDDVTRSDGRIVPSSRVYVVQAPDDGALHGVRVREGELVEAGDLIAEMDRSLALGRLDTERQRAFALEARVTRLRAEIDGIEPLFADALTRQAPRMVASEASLFRARRQELETERLVLRNQIEQQGAAIEEAEVLLVSARDTHGLLVQQIAMVEPLVNRNLEPETSLLQLRMELGELDGRASQAASQLSRERLRLAELETRLDALDSRFEADALAELAAATAELAGVRPLLPALEERLDRLEIRAQTRGVVNRVHVAAAGGVVRAGQELVDVVPLDDTLLIEAFVRPADIAFLYPGQSVNVKVTAYDFSRYGALRGEVRRIGASAVPHPERDENVFVVDVAARSELVDAEERPLDIIPGMVAQVEFLSGRKTVLDYIIRPVVRVKDSAFRD